ncbi:MAG: quinone-dependent dihydroorotate dehydrogenase [Solirubrobacteraceae bacterium MAG38_C4-C5]|nr:quinone-dependent dihydroorotate dehydrogenase [Candidatus Siliceabacter maunaloa]
MSRSSTSAPVYRFLFKLVLERLDAETVHRLAATAMRVGTHPRFVRSLVKRLLAPRDPRLRVRALGLDFPSPIGVAAGVDKEGTWFEGLGALGFGFVEVGTLTARPQPGNPRPRVSRRSGERALVNSMGFPNSGAAVVAGRLRRRRRQTIVGVNIGKTKVVAIEDVGADYASCARQVAGCADYLVVNVSSPNTPGLRDMQAADRLAALIGAVRNGLPADGPHLPLLIKIAPDLRDEQIDAIADLALELGVDGIVAVNTTVDATVLRGGAHGEVSGGISGAPLKARALEVLRRLRSRVGERLVLISVGGIETPGEALERIAAGATLVQAYTALVYGGPLWPWRMNRRLSRLVREGGWSGVQEAVGTAASEDASRRPGSSKPRARFPQAGSGQKPSDR